MFGEHDKKALDALTTGEAKLVIEAVYWYRPNNNKNEQILNNGQEFYVYGTIKNIATWEQANADLLGNQFGGNMKSLTSKVWTTALKTIRDEEQWGLYTVSRSDQLTYDEILEPYGYGIQVYESTDIAERTQTYDESLSVEGPAPQMPALPDGADPDVLRPITIIKLYTNKHTDGYGQVTQPCGNVLSLGNQGTFPPLQDRERLVHVSVELVLPPGELHPIPQNLLG